MIRTFADCPDREEHRKGDKALRGEDYGASDDGLVCYDGNPFSMRNMDYSECKHPHRSRNATHTCVRDTAENPVDVGVRWCEAALCAKVCPRGYVR